MGLRVLHLHEEEVIAIVRQHLEKAHGTVVDITPRVGIYDYGDYAEFEGMDVYYKEGSDA